MLIFSDEWISAYRTAINHSAAYQAASSKWEQGALAYIIEDSGRAVILDLHLGVCRGAQAASADEALQAAAFVIEGSSAAWQDVLGGKVAPLMAIMRGKLKLKKGALIKIMPYAKAAEELVICAQTIPTEF